MANKFRNEKVVVLGGVEILLRPTFENCANLESSLGFGIPQLAFNLGLKKMPGLTEMAKVVYFCQAEKKLTLEEIWEMIMHEGAGFGVQIIEFVGAITAGDKSAPDANTEAVKKN